MKEGLVEFILWQHATIVHAIASTGEFPTNESIRAAMREIDNTIKGNKPGDYPLTIEDFRLLLRGTLKWALEKTGGI